MMKCWWSIFSRLFAACLDLCKPWIRPRWIYSNGTYKNYCFYSEPCDPMHAKHCRHFYMLQHITKFLLAVIFRSPPRHSNRSKTF